MDVYFNSANYSVPLELQFIQPNGIPKVLLGRTEQLESIDEFMTLPNDKTRVISMGTTRGMGKTTMCKYLATKHENEPLNAARAVGRLIVYEMKKYTRGDPLFLWRDLIVHHLCYIFRGCTVDGVKFRELDMNKIVNGEAPGAHDTLVTWIENVMTGTDASITELIRLTNIAFGVSSTASPVFILDEVQTFLGVVSFNRVTLHADRSITTEVIHRTQLSLALTNLPANCYAIVAGIIDGNLSLLVDGTFFMVRNIYLSPLSIEQRFRYGHAEKSDNDTWPASFEEFLGNADLMCLMSLTYGVPRLCMNAVKRVYWKYNKSLTNLIIDYTNLAEEAYQEFRTINEMEIGLLSHIVMACGCGFKGKLNDVVPGTNVSWVSLIQTAVVFPSGRVYKDRQSFIFPIFVLTKIRLAQVELFVSELISGVAVTKCYFDYSRWITETAKGLYTIGIWWEDVVVNSFAIKYYLVSLSKESICLSELYDFESDKVFDLVINLKDGIVLNANEIRVNDFVDSAAIFHQKNFKKALYDFLCSQLCGQKFGLLPAQCKNALTMSSCQTIEKQLNDCEHLLWIYPGFEQGDEDHLFRSNSHLVKDAVANEKIVFLNGYGCCNTLTVDMIILLKNAFKQ